MRAVFHVEQPDPDASRLPGMFHVKQSGPAEDIRQILEQFCPDCADRHRAWQHSLERYCRLLHQWTKRVNLISPRDRPCIVSHHIAPALAFRTLARAVDHERIVDVGSGAGLPGIPLSITLPQSHVVLVESRRRRAHFLRRVVAELELSAEVVHGRVEKWIPLCPANLVVARAVAAPDELRELTRTCRHPAGHILTTLPPGVARRGPSASIALCEQRWRGGQGRCALFRG
ncbi:MAG: 16S rRNA (guanine(527)-N(7))-methyltransferase RsmG [Candidatus Latescibacterota bacterium]|nr:16S rRNA (guanine(527)-N(7))-methyltransferase RsmG [Candidatus Latescibacterota bacterium]